MQQNQEFGAVLHPGHDSIYIDHALKMSNEVCHQAEGLMVKREEHNIVLRGTFGEVVKHGVSYIVIVEGL